MLHATMGQGRSEIEAGPPGPRLKRQLMAKKKKKARRARKNLAKEPSSTGYVAVSNPSYGTFLKGVTIYYEGGRAAGTSSR